MGEEKKQEIDYVFLASDHAYTTPTTWAASLCSRAGNLEKWLSCLGFRCGAPEGIRTPDPQIRSLVLYPAELPAPLQEKGGAPVRTKLRTPM
jgi:hypothetical protein